MGVIITIRNRFGYVIVGLIAIAIIGFLIMDTTNSRTGIFSRTSNNAGVVNGVELSIQDYQKELSESEASMKQGSPDHVLTEDQRFNLNQQTWENFVRKQILGSEYDKLGIDVTMDEQVDMWQGEHLHPIIKQQFGNATNVSRFVEKLDEETTDYQMSSEDRKMFWKKLKNYIIEDRLSTKYFTLIKKGVFVTDWEAKKISELQQAKVSFDYVSMPFQNIPDGDVKITDSDLKDYLNKHQAEFKQEESRAVEYAVFNLFPSPKDSAKTLEWITGQVEKFREAKNDTSYLRVNSSIPFDGGYQKKEELASTINDTFFKIPVNTLVGPYLEKGAYVVAKLVDRKQIPDSVKVAQIVLQPKTQADVEPQKALADSLKKLVDSGANFDSLVSHFSADPAGKQKGGDLGFIKPDPKSPLNSKFFFEHKQGDAFIEYLGNTIRIFRITTSVPSQTAVRVGFLAKPIVPSTVTKDSIYALANKFAGSYSTDEKFKGAAKEKAISPSETLTEGSYRIGNSLAREVVKWVFAANKGDVSPVFKLEDRYMIVHVTAVREKGVAKVDDVRLELEQKVRKEKKADMLKAKIDGAKDLQTVASKAGQTVKTATDLSYNNSVIDGAQEVKVPSAALGMKVGDLSKPIVGTTALFVIQLKATTPAPAATNYDQTKMILAMTYQQRVPDQVYLVLKDAAKIKDERMKHNLY